MQGTQVKPTSLELFVLKTELLLYLEKALRAVEKKQTLQCFPEESLYIHSTQKCFPGSTKTTQRDVHPVKEVKNNFSKKRSRLGGGLRAKVFLSPDA